MVVVGLGRAESLATPIDAELTVGLGAEGGDSIAAEQRLAADARPGEVGVRRGRHGERDRRARAGADLRRRRRHAIPPIGEDLDAILAQREVGARGVESDPRGRDESYEAAFPAALVMHGEQHLPAPLPIRDVATHREREERPAFPVVRKDVEVVPFPQVRRSSGGTASGV